MPNPMDTTASLKRKLSTELKKSGQFDAQAIKTIVANTTFEQDGKGNLSSIEIKLTP